MNEHYLLKFSFKHLIFFDDCQILSLFLIFLVKLANNKLNKKNNIANIIVSLIIVFPVLIELDNILVIMFLLVSTLLIIFIILQNKKHNIRLTFHT
ncbi:MAG: hypothetical protein N4P93_01005, partial [Candidatus Lightella neohaematopini]|nr:hypothetical protein [Candidatus Lightella neohaematopini]